MSDNGNIEGKTDAGVATGVWEMVAVPTIHEYVGLPINDLFACGLLCEFRPGLVAATCPVKEPITAKRQSSTHTFFVRYPDKIVRMDAEVHVSIIPWKVSREQLREIALEVCREHEPLCEDAHDEGTPEFYDILCSVERGLAKRYRESGASVEYDD
jgi:hypothetical protein